MRHLSHHGTAAFRFSLPLVSVLTQLLHPFAILNEKFFDFARSSSFARRCSTSMFNSVICRRITGTGSDPSSVSGGGILRTNE